MQSRSAVRSAVSRMIFPFFHCVHVDAGLRGADIYGRAYVLRHVQGLGNAFDQGIVAGAKALLHQSGVAAQEIDAGALGGSFQGFGHFYRILGLMGGGDQGDGSHRDPLMDDRDSILLADVLAGFHQIARIAADFVVNMVAGAFYAAANAVQQGNPHGNGTYVQVFIINHGDSF